MDDHTAISAIEDKPESRFKGKAKSSSGGKAKSSSGGKAKSSSAPPEPKRSINLSLPVSVYERFVIHAMKMTKGNISELVCQLGLEHLRDYHVAAYPGRGAAVEGPAGGGPDDQAGA